MSNCKNLSDSDVKKRIRAHRRDRTGDCQPGNCLFCGGKLDYTFSIMASGEVVRVGQGHEFYPKLMERWQQAQQTGRLMTAKEGSIVIPIHSCNRAIALMDDVDHEDRMKQIETEKQIPADSQDEKRQSWAAKAYD